MRLRNVDSTDNPGGIPGHYDKVRDILCDNAAGPDSHASPNGHAGQDGGVAADPAILTNLDRLARLGAVGAIPQERIEWMTPAVKGAVRAYQCPRSYLDRTSIDPGAARVDIDTFPQSFPSE